MCGRYALALRPPALRRKLRDYGLPVSDPDPHPANPQGKTNERTHESSADSSKYNMKGQGADQSSNDSEDTEGTRQSYNIAPGYIEPVYRAVVSQDGQTTGLAEKKNEGRGGGVKYIVQGMKWGLVPSWTQQNPDYRTIMRTINCRDDSLMNNSGMWTSMKRNKRCIVLAEGFFEWRTQGKEKIPHYIKRQDGQLMYMAGLWDSVTLPDPSTGEPNELYTYTIITVPANSQMQFLHDRMPAFLTTPGEILTWLDPSTTTWTPELQKLLRPFPGTLEIYPVPKEVGKVGNNDKKFVLPIDSKENRSNIKNWFGASGVKRKPSEGPVDSDGDGGETHQEMSAKDSKTEGLLEEETKPHVAKAPKLESEAGERAHPEALPQTPPRKKNSTAHPRSTRNQSKKKASIDGNLKITNFFPK